MSKVVKYFQLFDIIMLTYKPQYHIVYMEHSGEVEK